MNFDEELEFQILETLVNHKPSMTMQELKTSLPQYGDMVYNKVNGSSMFGLVNKSDVVTITKVGELKYHSLLKIRATEHWDRIQDKLTFWLVVVSAIAAIVAIFV